MSEDSLRIAEANQRAMAKTGPLEVREIEEAKLMWIKSAQRRQAFSPEIANIGIGRPIGANVA